MLTEGAVVSIHYRGGRSAGTNFLWEVNGTDGDVLVSARSGQLQMASPTVSIGRGRELADITPPSSSGEAANVVEAYGLLATGRDGLASFADAAARHDHLARVEEHATAFQSTTLKELHA
jgi:predicted dehydrogenase